MFMFQQPLSHHEAISGLLTIYPYWSLLWPSDKINSLIIGQSTFLLILLANKLPQTMEFFFLYDTAILTERIQIHGSHYQGHATDQAAS
jgi:hypothetical protein